LGVKGGLQFARVERHAVAGLAVLDPQRRRWFQLGNRKHLPARRTRHAALSAQIPEMHLPQIHIRTHSTIRTKGHRIAKGATTVEAFHPNRVSGFRPVAIPQAP
jgi:hypothetical protein